MFLYCLGSSRTPQQTSVSLHNFLVIPTSSWSKAASVPSAHHIDPFFSWKIKVQYSQALCLLQIFMCSFMLFWPLCKRIHVTVVTASKRDEEMNRAVERRPGPRESRNRMGPRKIFWTTPFSLGSCPPMQLVSISLMDGFGILRTNFSF